MRRLPAWMLAALVVLFFGSAVAYAVAQGHRVASPGACVTVSLAVVVDLNNDTQASVIDHERDAVRAGQPRILHLDRVHADEHRAQSLRGIPTAPGKDRDEYPPAATREGGTGADVRLIPSRENRSAGGTMGRALSVFCDGQAFILEP